MEKRIPYYDLLRAVAILAVLLIHSLNAEINNEISWIVVLVRQLINFAVPLFIALSGYFMVDKVFNAEYTYKMFLQKQISRVYLPYLVWSLPYIFVALYFKGETILNSLYKLLTFQISGIFYYVFLIIQFYIFFPLLKKMTNKRGLVIATLLSFICCLIFFFLKLFLNIDIPLIIYAGNFITWIMFFILGMYLKRNKVSLNNKTLIILIFLSLILELIETKIHFNMLNNIGEAITAVKISSFIYSGLLIILLLKENMVNIKTSKFLESLGQVSYAIYLNHLLVLIFANKIVKLIFMENTLLTQLLVFLITMVVSYLLCIMIKSIDKSRAHKYLGI
ncbi:acyltransferase [Albibacterium bauzanense]|uniref:Surface polysaccharide O-acyltransferase-like enzyme n=1 Tax=Albibacterium bauzanense TaxID=653929 RepID=A0A4R1M5D0_9SPHI|nr:acyltransferase [Albibacterium bauzanense]TCK84953.1 surface polysaccharide O-acyltransferase-like enzyme [Albibacterium bauzanense]